uniref:Cytochrome b5 heme-binding domain-containing protein n=1 Tax=Arcella intermedia TaxID=1963864 RepID=A0A6B2LRN0_9EUKA
MKTCPRRWSSRTFTKQDLSQHTHPPTIYLAIKGKVFDVSQAHALYGPGGTYHLFAGTDATRRLAKLHLAKDFPDDGAELTPKEQKILGEWYEMFIKKYPILGDLASPDPGEEE